MKKWNEWKNLLFEYCNEYKQIPTQKMKYKNQNIGSWLSTQKKKIKYNSDDVYIKLSENKYVKESVEYYLNPEKKWNEDKDLLFEYCNEYKQKPLYNTK